MTHVFKGEFMSIDIFKNPVLNILNIARYLKLKKKFHKFVIFIVSLASFHLSVAEDFQKLDEALPTTINISGLEPVFDFDSDSCLPSAGMSRRGEKNGGLKPSGGITSGCRSQDFLSSSNTLHRYVCRQSTGATWCGHVYALYFEKDQVDRIGFLGSAGLGHRHDWENVVVWTKDGVMTHGSYSAHGGLVTKAVSELAFEGTRPKFVYHKDGVQTHAMRFAKNNEIAENPYDRFVTPTIVSWYEASGDGISNPMLRTRLNNFDYGSASIPLKDNKFISKLNESRPSAYPQFTHPDARASNPNRPYEAMFFSDCNYQGNVSILPVGQFDVSDLQNEAIGNDRLSSVKVFGGTEVVLYQHGGFAGSSRSLRKSTSCLDDFNDETSSLEVR